MKSWCALLLCLSCSSTSPEPAASSLPSLEPAKGLGAVFWTGGKAELVGEGAWLLSRRDRAPATTTDTRGPCGGLLLEAPLAQARLAAARKPEPFPTPPLVQAEAVSALAGELATVLPPLDRFSPAPQDALQGVAMGTTLKVRRHLAPPALVASATRDCTGVVGVVDHASGALLTHELLPGLCGRTALLPPTDLDGDGNEEIVLYADELLLIYALEEEEGRPRLRRRGGWTCPGADGGSSPASRAIDPE